MCESISLILGVTRSLMFCGVLFTIIISAVVAKFTADELKAVEKVSYIYTYLLEIFGFG